MGRRNGSTIRDHLWIFTVAAGGDNDYLERAGVRGGSRMTPAEGAFYLNVPNLLLIRENDRPRLPDGETWRAQTEFEQYATAFRPLSRVVWSVVGSGGQGGLAELPHVLRLAQKFPNISGIYLDDFIVDARRLADGRVAGRPAIQPAELKAARERLRWTGRPMDVWVTLYTHEINRRGTRPARPFAAASRRWPAFSTSSTCSRSGLGTPPSWQFLDDNLEALERIAPKKARIALGLYIWDFHNGKPVPPDLMRHQCERGLAWLQEGRIQEMIFLANTVLDVGLPSAEFAREWIAKVGGLQLKGG